MSEVENVAPALSDAEIAGISAKVTKDYDSNDQAELAGLFDDALRKHGVAMRFWWLWSRAHEALNAW